jgi:hypothetical protein
MTRHRQLHFPNPFTPEEIELDPEKGLWVPKRKTFFLPTIQPASLWDFFDRTTIEKLLREDMRRGLDYWDMNRYDYCECVPGRQSFISRNPVVPTRNEGTWNDVKRSDKPQFRSERRERMGILYDRHFRRMID